MHIAVIGAGYVGLTTAACFAHLGHDVICADIDEERVARLNKGEVPILEKGLPELVSDGLASHRLRFVIGAATRRRERRHRVPLRADAAGRRRLRRPVVRRGRRPRDRAGARPGTVVVNKSTVPVGTTRSCSASCPKPGADQDDISVASNPEFLREGQAVQDFLNPDRIVIGCEQPAAAVRVSELYRGVQAPVLVTDPASAEMIKYASNAFLATKISFINAIANLCEAVDADIREVAIGMGYDERIGFQFLHPGPGLRRVVLPEGRRRAAAHGAGRRLRLRAARRRRRSQPAAARPHRRQDRAAAGGRRRSNATRSIAVWGLTFKAETDDLRDSPSIAIARRLLATWARRSGRSIPRPASRRRRLVPRARDLRRRLRRRRRRRRRRGAHGVGRVPLARLRPRPRTRCGSRPIVDARNLLDPAAMRRRGFAYDGVGRDERDRHHRRGGFRRVAPVPQRSSSAATKSSPSTTCAPGCARTSPSSKAAALRARARGRRRVRYRCPGRSTACCTSRARRARPSTSRCRSRRWTSARSAPATRSTSPVRTTPASSSRRRARSTATRTCTRRPRTTTATSTPPARARCTTKRSASPRR